MSLEQAQFGSSLLTQPQRSRPLLTLDDVAQLLCVSKAWVRDTPPGATQGFPLCDLAENVQFFVFDLSTLSGSSLST